MFTLEVKVTSSGGAPVVGADLTLSKRGIGGFLAATSDDRGSYGFAFSADTGAFSLIIRKIGFQPVVRELDFAKSRSLALDVILVALPAQLDTVRTISEQLRSRNYLLDETTIRSTSRTVDNAYDALKKLRPTMLGDAARLCPAVKNVWINGKRVFWSQLQASSISRVQTSAISGGHAQTMRPPGSGAGSGAPTVAMVLQSVSAEAIEEIRYVNCWDTSMPELGTNDAVFITLKPGIGWNWKQGTYAVADVGSPAAVKATSFPRLLGVFDQVTGEPVEGAEVYDSVTTLTARTTRTGTVSLAFLGSVGVLRIQKSGYRSVDLRVTMAPSDTNPITLLLAPLPAKPPLR